MDPKKHVVVVVVGIVGKLCSFKNGMVKRMPRKFDTLFCDVQVAKLGEREC